MVSICFDHLERVGAAGDEGGWDGAVEGDEVVSAGGGEGEEVDVGEGFGADTVQ